MRHAIVIENIEALRRAVGIEDVELRGEIRGLRAGDVVRLTFLAQAPPGSETLRVRITRVQRGTFRGRLADAPLSAWLSDLRLGSLVRFTSSHVHSVVRGTRAN